MSKLTRKEIPENVKKYLKDASLFINKEDAYFKSLAQQLKSKNWLSEKQVQIVLTKISSETLSNH